MDDFEGKWGLITGASSGIGAEFCRQLAGRGMHLVLAARRQDRLEELAGELQKAHGIRTEIISCDLGDPTQPAKLLQRIADLNITLDLLVNNAGFGIVETLAENDINRTLEMIRLNIGALTELTYRVLPGMIERKRGGIINLASLAAFQPVAYMSAYAASKAYVLHFSEALWAETRAHGVTVMALCPGFTKTEFFDVAGMNGWYTKLAQTAPQVVRAGLKGLRKRRAYVVSGWLNYFQSLGPRLARRREVVNISALMMKPKEEK